MAVVIPACPVRSGSRSSLPFAVDMLVKVFGHAVWGGKVLVRNYESIRFWASECQRRYGVWG